MEETLAIGRDESVGMLFDHYEVERTLGRGAMGVVYLARDLRIGRRVALKAMPRTRSFDSADAEQEFLDRFRREAELCGSLAHPNIITLYEVGWEGRRISFLAMEYVDGETLLSLLQREKTLDLAPSLKIVDDILHGLAYAHERHVVHRDVKPANILITRQGQAKIADFGVARYARTAARSRTLTNGGQLIGTPYYMSPELIAGRAAEPSSDLFSVGVVLFELLSGKRPFDGNDLLDVLYNIVNAPTPDLIRLRPDLPPWVGAFVRRLLAKAPGDRFPSADAAIRELRRNLGQAAETNPLLVLQGGMGSPSLAPEETPTTPITVPRFRGRPRFEARRMVPTSVGIAVIVAATALLLGSAAFIQNELARSHPAAIGALTPQQLATREAILREARALYDAGMYDASAARYRAYLDAYPWSDAAREGELTARAALEKQREEQAALAERQREELVRKRPARRAPPASASQAPAVDTALSAPAAPPEPKPSLWRRIFRRPDPPPGG
ncbi:MAG TPA: protein kinase [Thermoanaerobaculia bacterium]|nr:protein kinase [Thermoanaerobaculia bacterium]